MQDAESDRGTYQIVGEGESVLGQHLHYIHISLVLLLVGKPGAAHVLRKEEF